MMDTFHLGEPVPGLWKKPLWPKWLGTMTTGVILYVGAGNDIYNATF